MAVTAWKLGVIFQILSASLVIGAARCIPRCDPATLAPSLVDGEVIEHGAHLAPPNLDQSFAISFHHTLVRCLWICLRKASVEIVLQPSALFRVAITKRAFDGIVIGNRSVDCIKHGADYGRGFRAHLRNEGIPVVGHILNLVLGQFRLSVEILQCRSF